MRMTSNRTATKKRECNVMEKVLKHPEKRVILGDITNQSNACLRLGFYDESRKPESKSKRNGKNNEVVGDTKIHYPFESDIYKHLRSLEMKVTRRPLPNYFEVVQKDANAKMRAVLVDWLAEVADEYKLVPDTLYLTVLLIDRFLSVQSLTLDKLQLLGVSCMLIASKYEEINPPSVKEFCNLTDNTYKEEEVKGMESDILHSLNFEVGGPTVNTFLRKFTMAARDNLTITDDLDFLVHYLAELSLLDYICIKFPPSMVAASVIFVSKLTIFPDNHPWNSTLHSCTGYTSSELKDAIHSIHDLQLNKQGSTLVAVRNKYSHEKYGSVAKLAPPLVIPSSYFDDIK